MAEHYEPPDPNYRGWATGAMLLELHSITGAWEEFRAELAAAPELAADVLGWICPEDDWQYASVQEAKRIAALISDSPGNPRSAEIQNGAAGRSSHPDTTQNER